MSKETLYELMVIVTPELTETQVEKMYGEIKSHLTEITFEDIWGKRKIAYPIKKHSEGFYAVWNFTMPKDQLVELEEYLRLNQSVLRYLLVITPADYKPMTHQDADAGVDAFYEEKKAKKEKGKMPEKKEVKKEEVKEKPVEADVAEAKEEKVSEEASITADVPVKEEVAEAVEEAPAKKEKVEVVEEKVAEPVAEETPTKKVEEVKEEEKKKEDERKSELDEKLDKLLFGDDLDF